MATVPTTWITTALFLLGGAPVAQGAEAFQIRYNLAGSLGQDLFAPVPAAGWVGSLTHTHGRVHEVTGDGGGPPSVQVPGGVAPVTSLPPALRPSYGASLARLQGTGSLRQWNLGLARLSELQGGSRWALGLSLPYATRQQNYRVQAATPALNWSPAVPPAARAAATPLFQAGYQAAIAALGGGESGEVSGFGDLELSAAWLHTGERMRLGAGATLVLPTGKYDAARGVDVGFGNFYTLRPAVQAQWEIGPRTAAAARFVLGLNTRNEDNDLRSGNWAALELAAGQRTDFGVFGVLLLHARQVQDDRNNPFGASRYRTNNAGVFYTVRLPAPELSVSLQHTVSVSSQNAKHGRFTQLRLAKAF
ncbi:transporter [Ramlibacter rhizophilus]|uniref:Transporter n=1 Tax=Ramlibacter rhizophilus TaxID=1781167 RepID=A0A4Z0BQN2_9BURK|nr:transporter [Ramlibacter rhizophilus]TFZ01082.1 transporter [Ramlibacter rhizophilus]